MSVYMCVWEISVIFSLYSLFTLPKGKLYHTKLWGNRTGSFPSKGTLSFWQEELESRLLQARECKGDPRKGWAGESDRHSVCELE